MPEAPITWMRTRELAECLGVHRNTLGNMHRQVLLREGIIAGVVVLMIESNNKPRTWRGW